MSKLFLFKSFVWDCSLHNDAVFSLNEASLYRNITYVYDLHHYRVGISGHIVKLRSCMKCLTAQLQSVSRSPSATPLALLVVTHTRGPL